MFDDRPGMCIIETMPPEESTARPHIRAVRLSDDERDFHDAISLHEGIDGASVMRKGMLDYGRKLGLEFPLKRKAAASPKKGGRS